MVEFGLTDSGFLAPRATDLLAQIRSEYEQATDLAIDWEADVFLGVISAVVADRGGSLAEMIQAVADARDPDTATGHQLDTIASLVGVTRIAAEKSSVDLTINGGAGVVVPESSEVEYVDGVLWITQEAVEIPAGGSVDVPASPETVGPISAAASSVDWEIITPVDGWDSVTSAADATPGRNRETDAELRLRRSQSLQITGAASLQAIRSNILEVSGIQAAVAIDNDGTEPSTVAGLLLPGKSLAVVVYPVLSSGQETELAGSIYARKPAGIETIGDQSETVTGADGFDKEIKWSYADEIAVDVAITVIGVTPTTVEDEIDEAITAYFSSRIVGEPARVLAILGILSGIEGVESATVKLNGSAVDIEPEITEIVILNSVVVT